MKTALIVGLLGMVLGGGTVAMAEAAKIQFEQTVYDFGKTSGVASVTGTFKFKNTGDAVLKIEPPKATCGCTVANLTSDTLKPGESGELPFTLHLGQSKALFDKQILVKSNDPKTPDVTLSIKAEFTPVYAFNPPTLTPVLAFGMNQVTAYTTLERADGTPLRVSRLVASKPWISATLDEKAKPTDTETQVRVTIKREGAPRRFSEFVHLYVADQTNSPAASIYLSGQFRGEVTLNPEALYWNVSDAKSAAGPESKLAQRVTIRTATGEALQLKNPQSSVAGMKVELVPSADGKAYDLVAHLDEVPANTVSGTVSVETSLLAQSRVEVPVIVNVSRQ